MFSFITNIFKEKEENNKGEKVTSLAKINNGQLYDKEIKKLTLGRASDSSLETFQLFFSSIPSETLNLLWFENGPYKNYDLETEIRKKSTEVEIPGMGKIIFTISMTGDTEPSLIDIMEPVDLSPNKEVEPLGYFPCYSGLNASQRGKYLMWLCDIDQPIDIGYVFLYYYGIERFLYKCPEKFNQAYAMILRLRKYHNVKSFPSYSFGALIGANLITRNPDAIKEMIDADGNDLVASLAVKASYQIPLNSKDIIKISKLVGFTNNRYIKSNYEDFCKTIDSLLTEIYGAPVYYIKEEYVKGAAKEASFCLAANISLKERWIKIKDLSSNEDFKNEIFSLLQTAHNDVKERLKNNRKKFKG